MIVRSAEFVISAVKQSQYPEGGMREIALIGRSNVGKSSLLNKLLGRRHLARTSSQPGKTQTINFFRINDQFFLVDLPGYGYAKVAKTVKDAWGPMLEEYFMKRSELALVLVLVDLRHPPTKLDVAMIEWLRHIDRPFLIVATKADKLSRGGQAKNAAMIVKELGVSASTLIMTSAETGLGIEKVWESIAATLQ